MTHGSLFSGIEGFGLAASWCGIPTLWQVEKDPFCQKVNAKNFPNAKRYGDINDIDLGQLEPVDIISGGFPCQPFSVAGKQEGAGDDRYLWPKMLEVIRAVRPAWVIGENVPGIIGVALDEVLASLEGEGYTWEAFIIPACGVDAPHRRERVWIVANRTDPGIEGLYQRENATNENVGDATSAGQRAERRQKAQQGGHVDSASAHVADTQNTNGRRADGADNRRRGHPEAGRQSKPDGGPQYWLPEPDVGVLVDGISSRLVGGGLNEILRTMQQVYGKTEVVKRNIRQHLEETPILFKQVLRRLDNITEQGKTEKRKKKSATFNPDEMLREVRRNYEFATAPHRRRSAEQQQKKPDGSVSDLPQKRTHEEWNMGSVWLQEPPISRVATGVERRVDKLKSLGNAIVPQVAYEIFKAIQCIDKEGK